MSGLDGSTREASRTARVGGKRRDGRHDAVLDGTVEAFQLALGVMEGSAVVSFWIGYHAECDRLHFQLDREVPALARRTLEWQAQHCPH
jgi:hypothetical protein